MMDSSSVGSDRSLEDRFFEVRRYFPLTFRCSSQAGLHSLCTRLTWSPQREVFLNRDSFMDQFHFGVFYSYFKLKEQEIRNIVWISECIAQQQKDKVSGWQLADRVTVDCPRQP